MPISAWVVAELGRARLGDRRRTDRLVRIASAVDQHPVASFPQAVANPSEVKALYRFFSNEGVDPGAILEAHREKTLERVTGASVLLAVQDTTFLNFDYPVPAKGLGPIGDGKARGLLLHSTLAVTPDGTPQGFLGWSLFARKPRGNRTNKRRRKANDRTPIEEKESYRWVESLRESRRGVPDSTQVVNVMDREGDVYEVFLAAQEGGVNVLVRSRESRRLKQPADEPARYLWDEETRVPIAGVMSAEVPRKPGRPARTANLSVRYAHVLVRAPTTRKRKPDSHPPFEATIVFATEENPPPGQEPIHWRLLTTVPVASFEDATRVVQWYAMRWRVEDFHLVLKSGFSIERLQLEETDRIERALAVYSVTAWRVLYLNRVGRANPTAPATTAFSDVEATLLEAEAHRLHPRRGSRSNQPPPPLPSKLTLRDAIRTVARMGGFLARRADGEPGVRTLWKGLRALEERVKGYEMALALIQEGGRSG